MPIELRRAAAQHREHAARSRCPSASACASSSIVDLLVVEVALHEVVVADDDALDERVVDRVLLRLHLGRDRALGAVPDVPSVYVTAVVVQQVDDARGTSASSPIGSCKRRDAGAELVLQLVERALERRAFAVELVDEDRARDAALLGELPRDLGLHLDAFDRRHDEQREVGRVERGGDVADEVGVARARRAG